MVDIAICLAAVVISSEVISGTTMKLQISGGKLFGAVCAGLSITDTIKASGAESEYTARVLGFQAKQANLEQELNKVQQIAGAIPGAAGKAADALFLLVGGILVIRGELTLGMLLAFNSLFDSFAEPVNQLVSFIEKVQKLKADMSRVEDMANDANYYPEIR